MSLSVRIQHHPKRPRHLQLLLSALGSDSKLKVIEDSQSSWSGCKKAIRSVDKHDSHILVLQDDILPAQHLIETAQHLTEILPEFPITLFSPKNLTTKARNQGKHWATTDVWYGMPAYIIPTSMALDFVAWSETNLKEDIKADDIRMATYLYQHRIKTFITAPSLVEHLCWRTSTMSEGVFTPEHRVANWFIGLEENPLDIDWSKGIDEPVQENVGRWHEFVRKYKNTELCRRE